MEDFRQDYVKMALTGAFFLVTTVFGLFLKPKFCQLVSWIRKFFEKKNISEEHFQKDITEIKKATEKVVQDWVAVSKLISQAQTDQNNFVSSLQCQFKSKSELLEQEISATLEEVFKRNDLKFQQMRLTVETVQDDVKSMKTFLQTLVQQSSGDFGGKIVGEVNETDNSDPTVSEIKYKPCSVKGNQKNIGDIQYDTSKLIVTLKKCLADLFKDAKLHLSIDRDEDHRELEIILTKLAEDREDIKKTILEAFSIAAEQAKRNYDQFGQIGEDTLKYIAVLNDNTNKLLKSKLEETDDALNSTISIMNEQTLYMDTVKKVIENVEGQFGDLFEKLEQIYKINMAQYGEIALRLENASGNWMQNVAKIEKMTRKICDDTNHVKQLFQEIKKLPNIAQPLKIDKEIKSKIIENNATESITIQDQQILAEKQENVIYVYTCWERMRSISCNVEEGCHSACKLICELEQRLGSLNESFEKLDEFIRGLNLVSLAEREVSPSYNEDMAKMNNVMQTNQGDAGDGRSQVFTSKLKNHSLAHKIQNAMAIDNAVKLIEIILRNVCGENNAQNTENIQSPDERSPNALTTSREEYNQDTKEPNLQSKEQ